MTTTNSGTVTTNNIPTTPQFSSAMMDYWKANPAALNGQPLPTVNPNSAVVTSSAAATQTQNNVKTADQLTQEAQAKAATDAATKAAATAEAAKSNTTTTATKSALETYIENNSKQTPEQIARTTEITNLKSQLDTLGANADARTANLISSISADFDRQYQQQEQANKMYEGGVDTAGIVSGRARYAPELQSGLKFGAIQAGIQALSDINIKKQRAILDVETARDERNYKLLQTKITDLQDIQKEERQAAQTMADNYYKAQKEERDNAEFVGKNVAPAIVSALTGDETHDNQLILDTAKQQGVPASTLFRYIQDYKLELQKAQPNFLQEYNLAKSQGFKGTYLDYKNASQTTADIQKYNLAKTQGFKGTYLQFEKVMHNANTSPKAVGAGNKISAADAKTYGLDPTFIGMDEGEFINSLKSPGVPDWYAKLAKQQTDGSITQGGIESSWKDFRQNQISNPVGGGSGPF